MKYNNYKFRTFTHLSLLKKHAKQTGEKLPKTWQEFYPFFLENESLEDAGVEFEHIIFQEEFQALKYTPNFFFVEDISTAEIIKKGSFKAQELKIDRGVKFISFPKGFKVNNTQANGCMVAYNNHIGRLLWNQEYWNEYGLPAPQYCSDDDGYLSITYVDPYEPKLHCRLNLPTDRIQQVLDAQNSDQLMKAIENEVIGSPLKPKELEYQLHLVQLVIKTLVYMMAMPEKCIDGIPEKKATPTNIKAKATYLKPPYEQAQYDKNPTTVGYHWRQLRHEKYYQKEHKNKEKGSRFIFIPPYEKGLSANTIKE